MANVLVEENTLKEIADSIRDKTGKTDLMRPGQMATEIDSISSQNQDDKFIEYLTNNMTSLTFPDNTMTIRKGCCYGLSNLESVNMPDTVVDIDTYSFYECTNLKEVRFSENLTHIRTYAFQKCGLESIRLPATLKYIMTSAFSDNSNLEKAIIDGTNLYIYGNAFKSCTALTEVIFKTTPKTLTSSIFASCTALTSIKVPWSEGAIAGAPWGATNATVIYNHVENE